MKKYLFMAVAAIAALSSCSNDNEVFNNEVKKESVFTATMEGFGSTRTTFDSENKCAAWEVGDEIVINAVISVIPSVSETALYTAQTAGTTTTFKPKTEGEEVSKSLNYSALFPATLKDMESKQNALPATITAEYGKFNMPMFYRGMSTELKFKNIGGVLAITVNNEQLTQVSSIKVSSSNCATSGKFTIKDAENIALDEPNKTENTVTVTYTKPVATDATGKVFYVAIPAQTYKNLKIEISNGTITKSMATKKDVDIVVGRSKIYNIKFEDNTKGKAKATIGGKSVDVTWVQLWANGPKFAEYNVGATSATDYGGYYCWGGTYKNGEGITWTDDHNTGSSELSHTGDDITDTATNLWGNNWRMPTQEELEALINSTNCDMKWFDGNNEKYNNSNVAGYLFTGKADPYKSNSVFLPAAGYCDSGNVKYQGNCGNCWSSTPGGSDDAYDLNFDDLGNQFVGSGYYRNNGFSVRAVLAE